MVNYKVRSFYEKDTGSVGADVIIFDDEGDVVDTLLVTTESTYNDLVEQLEGIDEKYIDKNELLTILQNTSGEIISINATTLGGRSSDMYSLNGHDHNTVYAPLSHVNTLSSEGVLGHAKVINNVSRGYFANGEALSAYQGTLLSNRIKTLESFKNNFKWSASKLNTYTTLTINPAIRLAILDYYRTDFKLKANETKVLHTFNALKSYKVLHQRLASPSSRHTILTLNQNCELGYSTVYSKDTTTTLRGHFVWNY